MYKIINHFFTEDQNWPSFEINIDLLMYFIRSIEYVGKGLGYRRFQDFRDDKLLLLGEWRNKSSLKLKILAHYLKNGDG